MGIATSTQNLTNLKACAAAAAFVRSLTARCWRVALLLALVGFASLARAEPPTVQWRAPEDCPSQAQIEHRLAELLRGSSADPAKLWASGRVEANGTAFSLRLALRVGSRDASRTLRSQSCDSLAIAAVWLMAIALDPTLVAEASIPASPASVPSAEPGNAAPTEGAQAPSAANPVVPTADSDSSAAGAATPRTARLATQPLWMRAGLFSGAWSAGLPAAQASLGLRVGIGFGLGYVELRGAHMFARSTRADSGEASAATQELSLAGCAQWGASVRGGPCLTLSALRSHAESRGISDPSQETLWWGSAGVAAQVGWLVFAPIELAAEVGAAVPIAPRPRFFVEGPGEVMSAWPVLAYAQLGISVRLE